MKNLKSLEEKKQEAKEKYREARKVWIADMTDENWNALCDAERNCKLLGTRI